MFGNILSKNRANKQMSSQTFVNCCFQTSSLFTTEGQRNSQKINDFLAICKCTYLFIKKSLIRSGFDLKHCLLWPNFPLEQQIKPVLNGKWLIKVEVQTVSNIINPIQAGGGGAHCAPLTGFFLTMVNRFAVG